MGKDGLVKFISVLGLIVFITFLSFAPVYGEEVITLEEALRLGLENNIAIKEGEAERRKAEIDLDTARRAFLPDISLSTSYTRLFLDEKRGAGSGGLLNPSDLQYPADPNAYANDFMLLNYMNYSLGSIMKGLEALQPDEDNYQTAISIQQPLYLGGKLKMAYQQAEKALELTELQQRQKKNELLFNIIQSYYNILLAEERVRIEEDALELIREHKRIAEVSYQAGLSLKTDLLQVEIEENKAILSLASARNDLAMARKVFTNLIGVETEDKTFQAPGLALKPVLDKDQALSLAREKRVEFKLLELNQEVLELSDKMEASAYLPNIVLVGNYQWQGNEFSLDDGNGSISLALSMNIYDKGFSSNSRKKIAEDLNKLALTKENLEELLAIEVENLLLRIEENKYNIELQKMNLQRAEESLALEEKRYQAGTGTNMEVLNAWMVLKTTKIASIQADYQYELSLYQLLEKTGVLVDYCEEVIYNEK
ncbi:MAG: TolC family protein [Halanaerobiales bacterium]